MTRRWQFDGMRVQQPGGQVYEVYEPAPWQLARRLRRGLYTGPTGYVRISGPDWVESVQVVESPMCISGRRVAALSMLLAILAGTIAAFWALR